MVYSDLILHLSLGNDKFVFYTFLLAPDTDLSTFTTDHAHYSSLIAIQY